MKLHRLNDNYSIQLIEQTQFPDYSRASIRTTSEHWFKWVYELNFMGQLKFNLLYQQIMSHIYICYELTLIYTKRNKQGLFWINMKQFIDSNQFSEIIGNLIQIDKQCKHCIIILIYCLCKIFYDKMQISIKEFYKKFFNNHKDFNLRLETDLHTVSLKDVQNCEVCGFVGSALSTLIKRYKKLMIVHEKDEKWDE